MNKNKNMREKKKYNKLNTYQENQRYQIKRLEDKNIK